MLAFLVHGFLLAGSFVVVQGEGLNTCEEAVQEQGSALLQLQKTNTEQPMKTVHLQTDEFTDDELKEDQQPLSEDGFLAMSAQCCLLQADMWLRRFIPTLGLSICDQGGFNGFLPFVSCNTQMTFDHLKATLLDAMNDECPWVNKMNECKDLPAKCMGTYDPAAHRRRDCRSTTTKQPSTLTCCAKAQGRFLEFALMQDPNASLSNPLTARMRTFATLPAHGLRHKRLYVPVPQMRAPDSAISKSAQFDCAGHKEPIQVMFDEAQDQMVVKELAPDTGKYTQLYAVPPNRTDQDFLKRTLNTCAVNPIDSILYCTVTPKGQIGNYIVRVDEQKLEFVAKIGDKGNAGAFSSTGTFYWSYKAGFFLLRGLDGIPGVTKPTDVQKDVSTTSVWKNPDDADNNPDDMVVVTGHDLDDTGDSAEYVIGLGKTQISVTKVTDQGFQKQWKPDVEIEGQPLGGYGAAWNYKGKLYFANNAGNGVYQINPDDIDVLNGVVFAKRVGNSDQSGNNDGANCMNEDPPFPDRGDCDFGFQQIEPVNGQCPPGSTAQQPTTEAPTTLATTTEEPEEDDED